jgi:type II secretion system protein G
MPKRHRCGSSTVTGFTLVEMLVVIAIIAILAALLLPAVMIAIRTARNTAIAMEIKQLDTAIEAYRLEKGDYPPNFRNVDVVRRHIVKCYPRIDPGYFMSFMTKAFPVDTSGNPINPTPPTSTSPGNIRIDESESLVFWLSMTDKNPQYPFLPYLRSGTLPPADPKIFYDFDQTRLSPTIGVDVSSFIAKYCKDSFYIYIDSRSYDKPYSEATDVCRFLANDGTPPGDTYAFADDTLTGVRPYWSTAASLNPVMSTTPTPLPIRDKFKPVNATTFQIICAGQDGDFGYTTADSDAKVFPLGTGYNDGDKDNITNFSGGKMLNDLVP